MKLNYILIFHEFFFRCTVLFWMFAYYQCDYKFHIYLVIFNNFQRCGKFRTANELWYNYNVFWRRKKLLFEKKCWKNYFWSAIFPLHFDLQSSWIGLVDLFFAIMEWSYHFWPFFRQCFGRIVHWRWYQSKFYICAMVFICAGRLL